MTLSRFLRDYLYIAMGGNRLGRMRRYINLMVTMVLGGLWHGAGWNFAIWGGLHGLYLVINHSWITIAKRLGFPIESPVWKPVATTLTFLAVCFAWVFFRAPDLETSIKIIHGMTGGLGLALPEAVGIRIGTLRPILESSGITFFLGGGERFIETWFWVTVGAIIAFCMPNTQQIISRFHPAVDFHSSIEENNTQRLIWTPSPTWAFTLGLLFVAGLLSLNSPSEFLYFQF